MSLCRAIDSAGKDARVPDSLAPDFKNIEHCESFLQSRFLEVCHLLSTTAAGFSKVTTTDHGAALAKLQSIPKEILSRADQAKGKSADEWVNCWSMLISQAMTSTPQELEAFAKQGAEAELKALVDGEDATTRAAKAAQEEAATNAALQGSVSYASVMRSLYGLPDPSTIPEDKFVHAGTFLRFQTCVEKHLYEIAFNANCAKQDKGWSNLFIDPFLKKSEIKPILASPTTDMFFNFIGRVSSHPRRVHSRVLGLGCHVVC